MNPHWKRNILAIWFGQSVSLLTSAVLQMSIIWYITLTTGSAIMVTLATVAGFMPQAVLGAFTGPIIDRAQKKWVIIIADTVIACASLVLAGVALFGELPLWLIYLILVVRSLGTAFHEPAAQALTPLLVPTHAITQYAGYAQAFDSLCLILSPALAILAYNSWDMSLIMLLDGVGAAVAIGILLLIPVPKETLSTQRVAGENIITETRLGIRFLRQQEGIMPLILLGLVYSMVYSPVGSLYPHITMVYFGGSTAQSGVVETIFSLGSLLGAMLLGRLAAKIPKLWGLMGSIFLYGLGVFVIGWLSPEGYTIFAILSFFVGITTPFYHGITRAIYQMTIPQEYLGRTFAVSQSAKRLGMPIGLICGGLFADGVGINILFAIAGGLAMVLAVLVGRLPSLQRFKALDKTK